MAGQIIFIIWRESVEALLVIGILYSWLSHSGAGWTVKRYLWGGVAAGILTALALAFALERFSQTLTHHAQQVMMTLAVFIAAGLIVQMVAWMRAHGATLKRDLHQGLNAALDHSRNWSIFILALLAVAREGSETVLFLYGTLAAGGGATAHISLIVGLGFVAAFATYVLLHLGKRLLPWRHFFRITEVMLLLLGCALFVTGAGNLVGMGVLPFTDTLWDTSWLLDDMGRVGGIVAALTGYRAAPDVVTLGAWAAYAAIVWAALRLGVRRKPAVRPLPAGE